MSAIYNQNGRMVTIDFGILRSETKSTRRADAANGVLKHTKSIGWVYHVSMPQGFHAEPPPPEAPRFDPVRRAWTLSRYADVSAARREPALIQASAQNRSTGVDPSEVHARVQADIARMSAVEWRMRM